MHNKVIQVYEHQSLRIDHPDFGRHELALLEKFRGDKEDEDFNFYSLIHNGIKFKQYVGVLCVGNLQIEVLPKADRNAGENEKGLWKNNLLMMLKAVYKLKVDAPSESKQNLIHSSSILDVFIQRFLDEVERILHIGLVKTYRKVEDNCTALKGKLLVDKQITKNLVHKERFYVSYTTYDRNHVCNRILYKALKVIPLITGNSYIKARANTLQFEFPELNDIVINEGTFKTLVYNRKTEDYRMAMELAKLLLLHYMPNLTSNNHDRVLALMFDMNKLWEEFVYVTLRRQLKDYTVTAQNVKRFWESLEVGKKTIRPDIVISNKDKCIAVLDTKWKCPTDNKPADGDLKQMYVYHQYWKTAKTLLLYPGTNNQVNGLFTKKVEQEEYGCTNLHCSMLYLPISSDCTSEWKDLIDLSI